MADVLQKPEYLLEAERKDARLKVQHEELRRKLDAGLLTEDEYKRRHTALLWKQVRSEMTVQALTMRWETFEQDGD